MLQSGCRPGPPRRPLQDTDPVFVIPAIKHTADAKRTGDIPRLIDLLESEDSAVRLAAIQALEDLTGEDHGYRPWATAQERAQAVARWRQWSAERGFKAVDGQR
jgi:hypothetical protein